MFDFFRDMALEAMGKDSVEEERKRKEKRELERKKYCIFSRNTRIVIFAFGILYLVMGGTSLFASRQSMVGVTVGIGVFKYIKYAFLSAIDVAAMVCLLTGKKKAEIAALVLVIIFVVFMYVSSMMVAYF